MSISPKIKLCKNGCDARTYRDRTICHKCCKAENRKRWEQNKKYYNKYRLKDKKNIKCAYCGTEFETSRDNQKFCSGTSCHDNYHYAKRSFKDISRAKAINKIYDKDKKRIGGIEYTQKEIKYIIKNYHKKNAIEIADHLDRPVSGVRWKIRKLKEDLHILPKGVF